MRYATYHLFSLRYQYFKYLNQFLSLYFLPINRELCNTFEHFKYLSIQSLKGNEISEILFHLIEIMVDKSSDF